nr:hypothetical protein [uncultured Brevundimonas sp.]
MFEAIPGTRADRAGPQRRQRAVDRLLKGQTVLVDLGDHPPGRAQRLQEVQLVVVALTLEKKRVVRVRVRGQAAIVQVAEIERRSMTAALEPHQVGRRKA